MGISWAALTPIEISEQVAEEAQGQQAKESWFNTFNRSRDKFAEKYGTRFGFVFNYCQQAILQGQNDEGKSRGLWYWNLDLSQQLWPGGSLIVEFEMDKNKGIDKFIPTYSLFNTNTGRNIAFYVPELYLEQSILQDKVYLAAGKLDLSDWFDANEVADSGDTKFLSNSLVLSQTIPFPTKGIGGMIKFQPNDYIYFQSGSSTVESTATKVGLNRGFNSVFFINELGLSPKFGKLPGNYRFIFHLTRDNLDRINDDEGSIKNKDLGFGLSFDQALTSKITLFMRYGFADQKVRDIEHFWSFGVQVMELIPARKFDCLGLGVAQSITGEDYRRANESEDLQVSRAETIYEAYYRIYLNEYITLTPNIQMVTNPNADKAAANAIACGLRFLLSF
ncbi:MAG: carbohydrate porin [Candidatus Omnitrophota bacterium]|nr:carbohydrate porin [Candidatus Omnitrophota bacterium]MBU1929768.1 carbohydrate porin [Candidatus Omnitrophota bacterium]MBU2035230.1 carbohydrate porin [Candidatus Omnitrophota bacterium]MBU2258391.1 carbohydrate porin [Candidatus Omnitrophota bacterium]